MFDAWTPWTWVIVAWGEVALAYVGYEAYLRWRAGRVSADGGEEQEGR